MEAFLTSDWEELEPAQRNIAVHVSRGAQRAIRQGHPWLYAQAIERQSHEGQPGDLAVIFDDRRRFLAVGLYDPTSPIRVRVLQAGEPAPINAGWFARKVMAAAQRRAPLAADGQTTGYRVIHGENDGLPGLVLDRYDDTCVLKLYTAAWAPHLREVLPALVEETAARRVVLRLSRTVASEEQVLHGLQPGQVLHGPRLDGPVQFLENGLRFSADIVHGQKTGFFFDHRHNRERVEALAEGREVLNLFAYTGAFSLYAARGGARRVVSQDISAPALAAALDNFALNADNARVAAAEHELLEGDAFATLRALRGNQKFDMVMVDPPSFAGSMAEVPAALRAYERLTRGTLNLLRPHAIVVMASCTARVTAEQFFGTVLDTAREAGVALEEIERTGHALDHPISFAEGAYLKCLFARYVGNGD